MGGGIAGQLAFVVASGDHDPSMDHRGTDWYVVVSEGEAGFVQRNSHGLGNDLVGFHAVTLPRGDNTPRGRCGGDGGI